MLQETVMKETGLRWVFCPLKTVLIHKGKISGYGSLTYSDGDVYEVGKPSFDSFKGDWRDGKMHGRGTYRYASGDIYEVGCLHNYSLLGRMESR